MAMQFLEIYKARKKQIDNLSIIITNAQVQMKFSYF